MECLWQVSLCDLALQTFWDNDQKAQFNTEMLLLAASKIVQKIQNYSDPNLFWSYQRTGYIHREGRTEWKVDSYNKDRMFVTSFAFFVINFEPIEVQTCSAPQNHWLNLVFVKDIKVDVEKMTLQFVVCIAFNFQLQFIPFSM